MNNKCGVTTSAQQKSALGTKNTNMIASVFHLVASQQTYNHAHPTQEKYLKMKQHDTYIHYPIPQLLEEILYYLDEKKIVRQDLDLPMSLW